MSESDPSSPSVRPTAATHAYWLMPGAVSLGSTPERDRFDGTLALGPPLETVFREQIELSRPFAQQDYVQGAGAQHSEGRPGIMRARLVRGVNASVTIVLVGIIATIVLRTLLPSPTALSFPITLLIVVLVTAVLALILSPRRNRRMRGNPMIRLDEDAVEEPPVDARARIQARITPSSVAMARAVPLLTCQVCQGARLVYDPRSGMTVCPNCETELPLYNWPIEVPAPDEPLLGIV